jgi:hypothetical protein
MALRSTAPRKGMGRNSFPSLDKSLRFIDGQFAFFATSITPYQRRARYWLRVTSHQLLLPGHVIITDTNLLLIPKLPTNTFGNKYYCIKTSL